MRLEMWVLFYICRFRLCQITLCLTRQTAVNMRQIEMTKVQQCKWNQKKKIKKFAQKITIRITLITIIHIYSSSSILISSDTWVFGLIPFFFIRSLCDVRCENWIDLMIVKNVFDSMYKECLPIDSILL